MLGDDVTYSSMRRETPVTPLDAVLAEHGSGVALARKLGITNGYLSDIRLGRATPSLPLAVAIARETGISITDLIPTHRRVA